MAEATSPTSRPLQSVTITYIPHDNLTETVYIAGSFTAEPWLPIKMVTKSSRDELDKPTTNIEVMQEFHLRPGRYQYKFRIGEGDYWVCDERHEIVKDEQGNSNNLLIVHDQKEAEDSAPDSLVEPNIQVLPPSVIYNDSDLPAEELAVLPDSALGTWHPDEELSPMHRRASTNLGVRISRIGTFLPPEEVKDEGAIPIVQPLHVAPVDLETKLHKIEQEGADSENMSSGECESEPTKRSSGDVKNVTVILPDEAQGHERHVSGFDRIAENPSQSFQPASMEGLGRTIHWKSSGTADSYDTSESALPVKTNGLSSSASSKLSTSSASPLLKDDQADDDVSTDGVQDKKSEDSDKEPRRGLVVFALLASWLRGIWRRLFGVRSEEHKSTIDSAK